MQWFEGTKHNQKVLQTGQQLLPSSFEITDFSYLAIHEGHEVFMVQLSQLLQDFYFFPE